MPRKPRVCIPGLTHHVTHRGNNRGPIFHDELDYELYLDTLTTASARYSVAVHGYALMPNHTHLMLTPAAKTSIGLVMQAIGRRYVYHFNRRHQRKGGLFEGRYRSFPLESERYWFRCLRYVELNPVRAGLVDSPETYSWSSHHAHARGEHNPLLSQHPLYVALGATPLARQQAWRETCREALPDKDLEQMRELIRRGWTIPRTPPPQLVAAVNT